MGHRRNSLIYKLTFADNPDLEGLEIITRGPTFRQLCIIVQLDATKEFTEGPNLALLEKIYEGFASRILEWNHEDEDGNALPATLATLEEEDHSFIIPVIGGWMETIIQDPRNQRKLAEARKVIDTSKASSDEPDLSEFVMQSPVTDNEA